MKTLTRAGGQVILRLPDEVPDPADLAGPRGRRRSGAAPDEEGELAVIVSALEAREVEVADRFQLDLQAAEGPPRRRRRAREPEAAEVGLEVSLEPDEAAVILTEEDGTYEWHFPEKIQAASGPRRRRLGEAVVSMPARTAVFRIPIGEGPLQAAEPRRGTRGPIAGFIKGRIKALVLKFVAKRVVGALSRRLEKGVVPGPVIIDSFRDAREWKRPGDLSGVALPTNRTPRVLLLIHGTFSSTVGSFGALTEYEPGRRFLAAALEKYDLVMGRDHLTLAETPAENAESLHESLVELSGGRPLEIDAIAYSRGGLVYRYLSEEIAPRESASLTFRKAIFVGCTNAGTELAEPQNWKYLADFYMNMVAGGARLLGLLPNAKLPAIVLQEGAQSIASLVEYMARDAVTDKSVPGLAAMEPDGNFVKALNRSRPARSGEGARFSYAVSSDFGPEAGTAAGQLGKRFVLRLANGFIDRLMRETNDLVVDTDSMSVLGPAASVPAGVLPFGVNGEVYHTVYFHQPRVAMQLGEWLDLFPAARGDFPRSWWPAAVSDDFCVVPAETSAREVGTRLAEGPARFVVVERHVGGWEPLFYGISRLDLLDAVNEAPDKNASVTDVLGLHESDSRSFSIDEALAASGPGELTRRSLADRPRFAAVVVDAGQPIGVVTPPPALSSGELSQLGPPSASMRPEPSRPALRRVRRGGGRGQGDVEEVPSAGEGTEPAAKTALCHVHASMDGEAVVGKKAPLEVILSRETIDRALSDTSRGGEVPVDVERDLIVQVMARNHCVVSGESRVEVPVPTPGEPTELYFDIIPEHEGLGEVDVIVRQGNRALVKLTLRPRFVGRRGGDGGERATADAEALPLDSRRELPNVLYIREGQMGTDRVLHFNFESRGLNCRADCRSEPFKSEDARRAYIENLYQQIEDFWADDADEYASFMLKLRAFGSQIFKELFPLELQELLWKEREQIKHIQVFSEEPFIPWEIAYLTEPGKKAKPDSYFLAEKGMVRWWAKAREYPPTKLRLRPGKAVYVIPDYPPKSGQQLAAAPREREVLERLFDARPLAATSLEVTDALTEPGSFDLLHFACHGVADPNSIWNAGLLMKGKMKGSAYEEDVLLSTQVEAFADLREEGAPGPLVFLNACQIGREGYSLTGTSGFAKAFVSSGAGAFVGSHWSVGDGSALGFAKTFYQKLLDGEPMMTAMAAAREAAKNDEEVTWLAYVVYADPYAELVVQ